jgi:hypothetical protein
MHEKGKKCALNPVKNSDCQYVIQFYAADFYLRKYAISTPKTKYLLLSENKVPDKTYIISFKHLCNYV